MKSLIKVERLNYSIPYGADILKNIDFELKEGELLGVLGRNGAGKTTLLDLLLGIRPSSSGVIRILDENPISLNRKNLDSICFLSQDANLKNTISVAQYLKFYASFYPLYSKDEERNLLDFFSLNPDVQIGSLSTGQQKKVQAVGALSTMPKLLLIDEMTAVMDPETRDQFFKILKYAKEENGVGIILATNIAEDLISRADKVLFIDKCYGSLKDPHDILNLFQVENSA
jgi:ABC-2 type transport system ATP-binding protein